jgi:hypothetical protein
MFGEQKPPTPEEIKAATTEIDPATLKGKPFKELDSFLHVRWTDEDGDVRYGTVETYDDESEGLWPGAVMVSDCIYPVRHPLPLERVESFLTHNYGKDTRWDAFEADAHREAEYRKAAEKSDALPDGCHVGKLFSVGVADGCAWYVITRVSAKSVHLEWRGYHCDNYHDQVLGWGGSFPKSKIAPLCRGKILLPFGGIGA